MALPTMDFEVYLNTNAPAPEREQALAELFANEDAAGVEYAVVMPSPTPKPDQSPAGDRRPGASLSGGDRVDGSHGLPRVDLRRDRGRPRQSQPVPWHDDRRLRAHGDRARRARAGARTRRLRFELAQLLFRSRGRSDPPPETGRRGRGVGAGRQPGAHSRHHLNGW